VEEKDTPSERTSRTLQSGMVRLRFRETLAIAAYNLCVKEDFFLPPGTRHKSDEWESKAASPLPAVCRATLERGTAETLKNR